MIAVIYSGSRYANWKLSEKGSETIDVRTIGINPFINDEKFIGQMLHKNDKLISYAEQIKKIYFFGAGASSKERIDIVKNSLSDFFRFSKVFVANDLEAAAKASCDDLPGIVCIIGGSSNIGFFDGKKVLPNNFGLGYALGDEGSSNWLGKKLIKAYLNESLPAPIQTLLEKKYDLDRRLILDKIYKQAHPNVFFNSFIDFLNDYRNDTFVKEFIKDGFRLYIDTYLINLHEQYGAKYPIYFVGTVAANFQDYLREVAKEKKIIISSVIKEPIYNLLNYYANKN